MNKQKNKDIQKRLDERIEGLVDDLETFDKHKDSEDYNQTISNIESLTRIKKELRDSGKWSDMRSERVITAILGLVGVLLILNYEKTDIVTTKTFGMVTRLLGV